jgi:hypothetical protein
MVRWLSILVFLGLVLTSCGDTRVVNDEVSTNDLAISFYADSVLTKAKVTAIVKVLAVVHDSLQLVVNGDTCFKSNRFFIETSIPGMRWDPISLCFSKSMNIKDVQYVFNSLTLAKQYDLALDVYFQQDSMKIGYTISRNDIPLNCCFESRNSNQEIFVLSDDILTLEKPEVEIRNQLDSFFLNDLEEIDSLFLVENFNWLDTLSKRRDTCLGFECASLFQQEEYNWKTDSSNFELIGEHYRPTVNTLVDLKMNAGATYQDFISMISAHHKWLEEKRNSLSILYFNKAFSELRLDAKSDRKNQEYVFAVRMMAPYRLRFLLD